MPEESYRFDLLGKQHKQADFSCGVESLDRYFHHQAGQDRRRGLAVPYVLLHTTARCVVGFYTLSMASIVPTALSPDIIRKLPAYKSFPAALLGRLAVDQRHQGRGFGAMLLMDALRRVQVASHEVATMAVVVEALDDQSRSFYESYRFLRFADDEYHLYLPMKTIDQLPLSSTVHGTHGS